MLLAAGSGLSLAASRFACRFSALEDELASARKERDQAAEEAAVLRQDKQDCERALAQHKEATRALSHNLQGKLADLEAQVAARAQENAELQKKVDNSALEVTAVLEQRATSNHELRIEHQKLQHNFRAKSEECTKLAKRLATQEQLVAAVEAELRSAQEAWSEVKELAQKQSKDMSDHQQRVHAIIVSEEALIDKIAQQRRQARQQEAKLRECKAELAISMVQVADLTATLKIRDSQISGLQAANAEHVQQHSESAARLKQLLADLQTSHQMVETLRKTVRDQHAAMEALRVSNQALYEKINQAQPADPHELHKLAEANAALQAQVQHLTTRCSLLEEQTEAAKHHRDEAQQPGAVSKQPTAPQHGCAIEQPTAALGNFSAAPSDGHRSLHPHSATEGKHSTQPAASDVAVTPAMPSEQPAVVRSAAPPGQQPGAPPAQVSAVEAALGKRAVEAAPLSGSQHRSQLFGFAAATQPASATERGSNAVPATTDADAGGEPAAMASSHHDSPGTIVLDAPTSNIHPGMRLPCDTGHVDLPRSAPHLPQTRPAAVEESQHVGASDSACPVSCPGETGNGIQVSSTISNTQPQLLEKAQLPVGLQKPATAQCTGGAAVLASPTIKRAAHDDQLQPPREPAKLIPPQPELAQLSAQQQSASTGEPAAKHDVALPPALPAQVGPKSPAETATIVSEPAAQPAHHPHAGKCTAAVADDDPAFDTVSELDIDADDDLCTATARNTASSRHMQPKPSQGAITAVSANPGTGSSQAPCQLNKTLLTLTAVKSAACNGTGTDQLLDSAGRPASPQPCDAVACLQAPPTSQTTSTAAAALPKPNNTSNSCAPAAAAPSCATASPLVQAVPPSVHSSLDAAFAPPPATLDRGESARFPKALRGLRNAGLFSMPPQRPIVVDGNQSTSGHQRMTPSSGQRQTGAGKASVSAATATNERDGGSTGQVSSRTAAATAPKSREIPHGPPPVPVPDRAAPGSLPAEGAADLSASFGQHAQPDRAVQATDAANAPAHVQASNPAQAAISHRAAATTPHKPSSQRQASERTVANAAKHDTPEHVSLVFDEAGAALSDSSQQSVALYAAAPAIHGAGGSAGRGLHDIFSTIPFGVALSDSDDDSPPQHQVTGPTGTKSVNQNGDQAQTPQRLPSTAVATPASSGCPCGEREFGLMLSCASCSARVHAHCVTAHAADAKSWICESCALLPAAQAAPPSVNPAGNGASKRKRQAGARGKAGKAPAAKRQAR